MRPTATLAAAILFLSALLAAQDLEEHRDISYAEIEGGRKKETTLDLYLEAGGTEKPIMVWIHGGAWSLGDKGRVGQKARALAARGFLLASINYRLYPRASFREQAGDVARAIRWVREHGSEYGGSAKRLFLMGHSAGAHLAALVATDPRYLAEQQIGLDALSGVVLLDGAGYDIPRQINSVERPRGQRMYRMIFSEDPATQREASPLTHVAKGRNIPPVLSLYVPTRRSAREQSQALADKLREAGVAVELFAAEGKTHATINRDLGRDGDAVTRAVHAFLDERLGRGRTEEGTIEVGGRERRYLLYTPGVSDRPLPLVIALHGGGGNAGQMESYSHFNALAEREGFAVVYPEAVDGNWRDGRDLSSVGVGQGDVDDVAFLRAVVERLAADSRIDRGRVFATGISNGAFMSNRLAAEASDLVLAVAPVVGGMAPAIVKRFAPSEPVSALIIQGDSDPLVPIEGGAVGLRLGRKRGETASMDAVVAAYLKRDGITGEPEGTLLEDRDPKDGTRIERRIYPPGAHGVRVHVYVMKGGGHVWPGRPSYAPELLIGKACLDLDGSELIWRFFEGCARRSKRL